MSSIFVTNTRHEYTDINSPPIAQAGRTRNLELERNQRMFTGLHGLNKNNRMFEITGKYRPYIEAPFK